MKVFLLLLVSSFVYAQEPQNKADNSTQQQKDQTHQEQPQATETPQQEEQKTPPENQQPKAEPQTPEAQKPEPAPTEQAPVEEAKQTAKPAVQVINKAQVKKIPAQPVEAPPEEPIPYYNPLHPQSPSAYQEGDLPNEGVSDMTNRKDRKHRFSIGGKLFDYHVQGNLKKININALADYGYSRKYFEVGPYVSMELNDFDTELYRFSEEVMFDIGAFFEVNFSANSRHAKNVPSIGLKAGYKRKENANYIAGQPYVSMKFFFNHQTAFFVSLAPYYQYKLEGERGEWGVEIPTGLRFYFY
ncbi:MAG: hypothetical protein OXK80_06260 [Bdellovibrionales bacterium]|nr:hypothetical protein [Bdellovibrionales bacterium]